MSTFSTRQTAKEATRQRKQKKTEERRRRATDLCRCGRPPANEVGEMVWCLLFPKPSGDEGVDADNKALFGSAADIHDQERAFQDLVWSLEGGTWQLTSKSSIETEYTRAFRRKARYSMEYVNAYLHLQRVGHAGWLQKFDFK